MIYDIRMSITLNYQYSAGNSRHLLRVQPRAIAGRQRVIAQMTEIAPPPDSRQDQVDFFGNATQAISHRDPHDAMTIRLASRVELLAPAPMLDISPDLPRLRQQWAGLTDLGPDSPLHFLGPSPRLRPNPEIAAFALGAVRPGSTALAHVIALGEALAHGMTFDPTATTVDTDPAEAFALRRGICQDFTHIMILGLRSLGIPAGYASGYLRTLPEGQDRLEGADAMHAWVRAWCGTAQGWVEYDPTNATLVATDHILVGHGRDYADVSPLVGHLRLSGEQTSTQAVDVTLAGP
ncbi:MAG: transglutaminase family protein [Paracoccaceae bacterium]